MHIRKSLKVRSAVGLILFSSALFLILSLPAAGVESKNFYFPEVRIKVQIDKDGSFTVDEYRTYEFQGRFSWAKLWIPLRIDRQGSRYDASLLDFSITDEQGLPLRTEVGQAKGRFEAKWYYSARDERRTFHIHYRVRGGIISYPDVSEFYWQVIGEGWDKPTHNAAITVRLPEPAPNQSDILVYGHGPLSGNAEIVDSQTARFTASYIRSGQFVEVRMVWPAGLVTGVPSNRRTVDSIRREEAQFVQDTIAQAKRDQERQARNARNLKRVFYVWLGLFILVPLIWLSFYLHFWKKVGKDYRFMDIPPYAHEPPSKLQPALVEVLLREGVGFTPKSFTATIFDLARRGYIEIEDRLVEKRGLFGSKDDYETTLTLRKEFQNETTLLEIGRAHV
jgi:uncharacterized membrane protein